MSMSNRPPGQVGRSRGYYATRASLPLIAYGAQRVATYAGRAALRNIPRAASYIYRKGKAAYKAATKVKTNTIPIAVAPRPVFRKKKTLKKTVAELKRLSDADTGTYIKRERYSFIHTSSVNQSNHQIYTGWLHTDTEAVIDNLKYFDPATPGTFTTTDFNAGTNQKEILVDSVYSKLTLKNNAQIPGRVTVYTLKPKTDTSISPTTAITNGLADIGNPTSTSQLIYATDSDQFTDLWKICATRSKIVMPGREISISHSEKNYRYDPAYFDAQTSTYSKKGRCFMFLVRVEGVMAHDSSASEVGFAQASFDVILERKSVIKYNAGAQIKWLEILDSVSTFTNGAVVSSMPVADNIPYSRS